MFGEKMFVTKKWPEQGILSLAFVGDGGQNQDDIQQVCQVDGL